MVKRKAEISLDEWLVQSVRLGGQTTTKTAETPADQPHTQGPALVETSSESKPEQLAAAELTVGPTTVEGDQPHVTGAEGEAHDWFWRFLEQAGFERW